MTYTKDKEGRLHAENHRAKQYNLQTPVYLSRDEMLGLLNAVEDDHYRTSDDESAIAGDTRIEFTDSHPTKESSKAFNLKHIDQSSAHLAEDSFPLDRDGDYQILNLQQVLSSAADTTPYHKQQESTMAMDSDEDFFGVPSPGNTYASPKFARQERLDVKKPGPWFTINNYAFESDEDDANLAANIWMRSNESPEVEREEYGDAAVNRDFRKNNYKISRRMSEDEKSVPVQRLIEILNSETNDRNSVSMDGPQPGSFTEIKNLKVCVIQPLQSPYYHTLYLISHQ